MSKHTKRSTKTGKYSKEGINDIDLYDNYKQLSIIQGTVIMLKSDLKRDCIPYYKYDKLVKLIEGYKEQIKEKDKLKELS